MENVIFEALAFDDKAAVSPSLGKINAKRPVSEIYLKNAVVSLLSIKAHNNDCDVAIVVNKELEAKWYNQLTLNGIKVFVCPFEKFKMPSHFVYSLSYYKLCAFDFMLHNTEYKKFCFIDCDTFGVGSFSDIWVESQDGAFLIIPNDESYKAKVRVEINRLYSFLYEPKTTLAHVSSGFIAGKRETLEEIMNECEMVYKDLMSKPGEKFDGGDEIVWSLAFAHYKGVSRSLRAYGLLSFIGFDNYWIDKEKYDDPAIVMWHLPIDKRYSLVWAYDWFEKHGKLPSIKKMAKASRFRNVRPHYVFTSLNAILKDRTVIRRNLLKLFGK